LPSPCLLQRDGLEGFDIPIFILTMMNAATNNPSELVTNAIFTPHSLDLLDFPAGAMFISFIAVMLALATINHAVLSFAIKLLTTSIYGLSVYLVWS